METENMPVLNYDSTDKIHYYTLKEAMALSPAAYEAWVYSPRTKKANEVRVVSSKILNKILTKSVWWVPLIFWPPIIAYLLWPINIYKVCALAFGLLLWFPVEYTFHRFLFHMPVKNKITQMIHYMIHGIHHVAPYDLEHLVAPPLELGIEALAIYGVLVLLHVPLPECIVAGLLIQYLRYDMFHYSVHAFTAEQLKKVPLIGNYVLKCKRHHMLHHFENPKEHFTISYVSRFLD
jgi:4-hydroxysphinganine ceramide fatty acyl 2-hydroxylase